MSTPQPEEPHLPTTEDIAALGRDLGRQLARLRRAKSLTQHQFAPLIGYSRGTLSSAESGRFDQARRFWQQCDDVLGAGGQLVGRYDAIRACRASTREQASRPRLGPVPDGPQQIRRTRGDASHQPPELHPAVSDTDLHIWFKTSEGVVHCLIIPRARVSPEFLADLLSKALGND